MPSAAVCISCISIHALCEEGDLMVIRVPPRYSDFYPRPLRGGRQTSKNLTAEAYTFLSTPSARRATSLPPTHRVNLSHFYPRPLRGGRPVQFICGILFHNISIHALCEEGDPQGCSVLRTEVISIHALCEEGDPAATPSSTGRYDFYPRPLRGGRRYTSASHWRDIDISIHALCEEGDTCSTC